MVKLRLREVDLLAEDHIASLSAVELGFAPMLSRLGAHSVLTYVYHLTLILGMPSFKPFTFD